MARKWRGPLWCEGKETTEFDLRRFIEPGVSTYRPLPLTLRAVFLDTGWGHENAVPVATIEGVEREPSGEANLMVGEGTFAENDESADRAFSLMGGEGGPRVLRGVSVDPTNGRVTTEWLDQQGNEITDEDEAFEAWLSGELVIRERWSAFEVGAATIVATPAFVDAQLEAGTEEPERASLVASSAVRDLWRVWDDGEVHKASSAPPANHAARLATFLRAQYGAEAPVMQTVHASSGVGVAGAVLRASVAWDDGPPPEFFRQLDLPGPTPFTVTDEGEVFGHIACWGQCHSGFLAGAFSQCVTPDRSPSAYRTFRANRQVRCSDGSRVGVGVLTMDTSHAPAGSPGHRPSMAQVVRHYEDTGLIAAHLAAFDDGHGIQVHGALAPGLSVDDVRRCMASAPSGDWRNYGEGLDLAGILQVNQPGYPVVEVDDGDAYMLTASLAPPPGRAFVGDRDVTCSCQSGNVAANGFRCPGRKWRGRWRWARP